MSVEVLRDEIIDGLRELADGRLDELHARGRVDRLILEVRAEMPCYWAWAYEVEGDCHKNEDDETDCPSCTARKELQG